MRRCTKATLALPVTILLLGVAVPLAVRPGARPDRPRPVAQARRRAGRSAAEWRELALAALEAGRHDMALQRIKTAESVDPGRQFVREVREIRRARRGAREFERVRERLLVGDLDHVELDPHGAVLVAYRSTVVLPGESLWSLARSLAAAEVGVPASEFAADDPRIFDLWDLLTDLNGLRELDVGERIKVPLPASEREAIASANAEDLSRIARGTAAVGRGDIEAAAALREAVSGAFALSTPEFEALDAALTSARRETLVQTARRTLRDALALKRTSGHAELIGLLSSARDALVEAERLAGDSRFAAEFGAIEPLLDEAAKYRVLGDGSVVAPKPSGVTYTDAVRAAVEWFLDRKLLASGREFPHQDQKTADEIGWARYLYEASDMARREGVDFAALLEADAAEIEVRLPNPGDYFAD